MGVQTQNLSKKLEHIAKNNQDDTRQRNIENAMKNLGGGSPSPKNYNQFNQLPIRIDSPHSFNNNNQYNNQYNNSNSNQGGLQRSNDSKDYYINNSRQERKIMPDPDDIDDIIENIYERTKQNMVINNNINNNKNNNNNNKNDKSNDNENFNNKFNELNNNKINELNITYSNVGSHQGKELLADEIDFADEKINNFERIYNFD